MVVANTDAIFSRQVTFAERTSASVDFRFFPIGVFFCYTSLVLVYCFQDQVLYKMVFFWLTVEFLALCCFWLLLHEYFFENNPHLFAVDVIWHDEGHVHFFFFRVLLPFVFDLNISVISLRVSLSSRPIQSLTHWIVCIIMHTLG